MDVFCNPVT